MRDIASVMIIIELVPAPAQTMMIGPKATFGRAFNTTKYGSSTAEIKSDHQRTMAIKAPSTVPKTNPTTVSKQEVPKCKNSVPSFARSIIHSTIREGLLIIKGSITSSCANSSQIPIRINISPILQKVIFLLCLFKRARYSLLSFDKSFILLQLLSDEVIICVKLRSVTL